ncbi:hypothetical protein [Roseimicrobium sp. ORNL1]|uniref:hypothetical protein n=1 Tax=Roseimicrobium sp. ORNL1 TaxID=2711231 RepID=UPI0013E19234|nr:hypothetical protein [Roseimicrobium sp. ORNL1]QIF02389.1 hypothetical protein G5S37_12935 [Roseimicrobium sp. ORNL1]
MRILALACCLLLATAALGEAWDFLTNWDEPGQETISQSEDMALARGTWRQSLQASPMELSIDGQTIHINSAWVEQNSHQSERWWGTSETPLDGYSLCFTLAGHSIPRSHYFTTGDDSYPVTETSWSSTIVTYTAELQRPEDASGIQLTLTTMTKDDSNSPQLRFSAKK